MNYYPHHIGDFNSATRHLTRLERGIYRDMLDMYYDKEKPLIGDFELLCRKLIANTEQERTAVQQVLEEFFESTDSGWSHPICEQVILEYHANLINKSAAGTASAAKRAAEKAARVAEAAKKAAETEQSGNSVSTPVEQTLNTSTTDEQLTKTKTKTNNQLNSVQSAPAAPATLFSIELRKAGIRSQPADPRLIALAEQGVTIETVAAACQEAIAAKPGETIGLGYVVAIIDRWARTASAIKVAGAQAPKKHDAWWLSNETMAAKGATMGMQANAGEAPSAFRARLQAAIDNGGVPVVQRLSRVVAPPPPEPARAGQTPEQRATMLALAGLKVQEHG